MTEKIMIIYSGGMDSFTLVHDIMNKHPRASFQLLSFNYGQRHVKELEFAMRVADELKPRVTHIILDMMGLGSMLTSGSALMPNSGIDIPEGHYAADNMKLTVVPGRNTIMLSMAMGMAEAWAAEDVVTVYYGAHAGDHTIYPDCRPEYVYYLQSVFREATEGKVLLEAPYIHHTKGDILRVGKHLRLDYSKTWSCYKGGEVPCGKCGACTERTEAFNENDMVDPWWVISREWEEKAKREAELHAIVVESLAETTKTEELEVAPKKLGRKRNVIKK